MKKNENIGEKKSFEIQILGINVGEDGKKLALGLKP